MDIVDLQIEIKELVERINNKHKHPNPQLISLMKVLEELGETTKIILSSEIKTRKGEKKSQKEIQEELNDELADTIIALISLANDYNVDINQSIVKKLEIHKNRN
jgi:NTP pyrophosphatase (non-canonical NTP hydrolase)